MGIIRFSYRTCPGSILYQAFNQLWNLVSGRICHHILAVNKPFQITPGIREQNRAAAGGLKTPHIASILSGHVDGTAQSAR
jgi:hypothetical protein